ncbi:exodeoxyribonuclease V subunit gamma [Escherichia fergusonii]|uniref:exodeoxyribonuclease V subunit gamma n=1 Tax=Escherichia fergusonii TaxID=564 RepID=UPI0022B54A96|nr:exodeoxyribonuclease V subunit gamma [Escherichia fergusonii]MCZ5215089.1 exodeoxyribonuclease V subunit gamma [Escherichia fergusonii]
MGIDDDNVRELELPATGQHTWRFGLTRMLLGYAMESAQGEWQSVLPYDESSGLIAELVGHLASLLMQLNIWRRGLAQERPLEEWLPVCRDMLNAFFLPDAETEAAMTLIEQQWQAVIAQGLAHNITKLYRFHCSATSWHNALIKNVSASDSLRGQ